jgi:hypothetical protein
MPTNIYGTSRRTLPALSADGARSELRLDSYGSLHARSELLAFAEEGTYFRATNNATPGTAVTLTGAPTAFSDTASVMLLLRNSSSTKRVIPHYIRLICTAAPTGTPPSLQMALVTDTADRYSAVAGGGADITSRIVNADTGTANTSVVDRLVVGATASAASAKRIVSRGALKTQASTCVVAGDEFVVAFADPAMSGGHGLTSGTGPAGYVKNVGPVVLAGANHCLLLHLWASGVTNFPGFEVEVAWWER